VPVGHAKAEVVLHRVEEGGGVRVVELGNLSAAGRDMRISPAVASNRIKELEKVKQELGIAGV